MLSELKVVKATSPKPEGIVLYSKSGMGKTTFLCQYVKAAKNGILFQCGEDGLSDLTDKSIADTPHFDKVLGMGTTQDELIAGWVFFKEELLKYLMISNHGYDSIAFDNFSNLINNNLEAYITKTVYNNDVKKANGYGGAKIVEMDAELCLIIKAFEYMQSKGISVILSCHNQVINFKSPTEEDYSKYTLGVPSRKDADLRNRLINWSSATLFGLREVEVENKKAVSDQRVLKTRECATWDAKCRYSIPESIEFSYKSYRDAVEKAKK